MQVLFQLVDVACALLINMGLEDSPIYSVINRMAIRWPDVGRNEISCGVPLILDGGTYMMGRCSVIPQTLVCTSGADCHGSSCSW